MIKLLQGDCLQTMKTLADNSVDAIVSDPPYGISFMAKKWDYDVPSVEVWKEAMRVLKPGGHALIACGTRTQHRMVVNIEDAGFEVRDVVSWIYGQGFPKSANINKSLTKLCTCGSMGADEEARNYQRQASEQETKHGVRSMQKSDIQETNGVREKCGEVLQQGLQEQGSYRAVLWEEPEEGTKDGKKSSMEGRSNLQASKGELHGSKICEVPEGVLGDGKERRIHNGTSLSNGPEHGETFNSNGGGSPRGSQSKQQQDRKPCPLCDEWGTQAVRRAASETQGWGTALKPSSEFFTLCRKPLSEKTIAANVIKWGTGGINIDGCRVEGEKPLRETTEGSEGLFGMGSRKATRTTTQGRFPANLIHDGSQEVLELFPETKSGGGLRHNKNNSKNNAFGKFAPNVSSGGGDQGSAARFFYCAKASKKDRDEGNNHPTVKPTALMQYLCRLITPAGGTVLDPYMGSGSTGKAAMKEGFSFVGCELDPEYYEIASARINAQAEEVGE